MAAAEPFALEQYQAELERLSEASRIAVSAAALERVRSELLTDWLCLNQPGAVLSGG